MSAVKTPPPLHPSVTVNTMEATTSIVWVSPGILATTSGWSSVSVDLWDVEGHLEKIRKSSRSLYNNTNMHSPLRTILCSAPLTSLSVANGLIVAGDIDGNISILDPSEKPAVVGGCLQNFSDHKGSVTDLYAVSHNLINVT